QYPSLSKSKGSGMKPATYRRARLVIILAVYIVGVAILAIPNPIATAQEYTSTLKLGSGIEEIDFNDLAPSNISLQQTWNGMGMDAQGRVYIGFTSDRLEGGEDFA